MAALGPPRPLLGLPMPEAEAPLCLAPSPSQPEEGVKSEEHPEDLVHG